MSYTAFEKMREANKRRFGVDLGPMQPPLCVNRRLPDDLKSAALRFLRKRCEQLRFDAKKEEQEAETGVYSGKSLRDGQIPYNMQMDVNRLCLEKALETFIDSGVAEDAYAVCYCWLEIFFGEYGKSRKMVELLSEYEANGSPHLMKHRDCCSHSVYVFALGLAVYETNSAFRHVFGSYYNRDPEDSGTAGLFLEFWGLSSLFHDIGYPFELPFEQVLSYFAPDKERGDACLFLAYHSLEALTGLDEASKARFQTLFGRSFSTAGELLAYDIAKKLGRAYGFTEEYMLDVLNRKPTRPDEFGYHMDHAFFSAALLCRELAQIIKPENLTAMHVDALSSIMLHNSLFKFAISFYRDKEPEKRKAPLRMELHPLAWLLMLCDELQCWERAACGRYSRTELHPFAATFDFKAQSISAVYYYDIAEREKIEEFERQRDAYRADPKGKKPRLKAYGDMAADIPGGRSDFTADIERIVDLSDAALTVIPKLRRVGRENKRTCLSGSSFLHFYDFAVDLHARNMAGHPSKKEREEKFHACSLEYQLSTLGRTRHFAGYLNAIDCFCTDRPVDHEPVTHFGAKDAAVFAPMEHERWVREHEAMGWRYGKEYETLPLDVPAADEKAARAALREQLRRHKLCMDGRPDRNEIHAHYRRLPRAYKDLDRKPFNNLLQLLRQQDGLRIYRL